MLGSGGGRRRRDLGMWKHTTLYCLMIFALASCSTESDNPASSWMTGPPPHSSTATTWESEGWTTFPQARTIELYASAVQSAIDELGDKPAVPLDRETFDRLTRHAPWPSDQALTPFLVRGVGREEPLGSIRVMQKGTELYLEYNGPIVRARAFRLPIILLLPSPPTKIYVATYLYG